MTDSLDRLARHVTPDAPAAPIAPCLPDPSLPDPVRWQVAAAYARYSGVDLGMFIAGLGPALTAERVAESVVGLAADEGYPAPAYLLAAEGLTAIT
jgi:hypothetical protein